MSHQMNYEQANLLIRAALELEPGEVNVIWDELSLNSLKRVVNAEKKNKEISDAIEAWLKSATEICTKYGPDLGLVGLEVLRRIVSMAALTAMVAKGREGEFFSLLHEYFKDSDSESSGGGT